ncbi:MAG TPA: type II secretion system protein GspM [Rhizomicrobium sp.]|jgi:cytoskeletal protein RodZ
MRQLSARERRLVSIGILVALVAVIWFGLISPILGGFWARAEERHTLQAQYERDSRTVASIPVWKREAQQQQRTEGQYAIVASTAELASHQLQDRLARSVGEVGGLVRSSVPDEPTASEVGTRVDLALTNQQLNQLLKHLESEEPYVVVGYISVAADRAFETGKLAGMDVKLQVSAVFHPARAR